MAPTTLTPLIVVPQPTSVTPRPRLLLCTMVRPPLEPPPTYLFPILVKVTLPCLSTPPVLRSLNPNNLNPSLRLRTPTGPRLPNSLTSVPNLLTHSVVLNLLKIVAPVSHVAKNPYTLSLNRSVRLGLSVATTPLLIANVDLEQTVFPVLTAVTLDLKIAVPPPPNKLVPVKIIGVT